MPSHSRRRSSGGGGGGGGGGSWGAPTRPGRSNESLQQRLAGTGAGALDAVGGGMEAAGDWAQGVWHGLFGGGDKEPETFTRGGVEVSPPFTGKATRGDFIWRLAIDNPGLGLGGGDRDAVLAAAETQGILTGEHERVISRAEAATVLVRALGLTTALPAEQVAYFQDVTEREWYFTQAHAARRHGIFHDDSGSNTFRGGDAISVDEARIVLGRAKAGPTPIAPEAQAAGGRVLLEPNNILGLLDAEGPLQVADIASVRAAIEALPEDQRGPLYQTLNAKVGFRNQRDNDSYKPDYACNMTSIAMVLNQLGLGEDDVDGKQFEDSLVDWWRDGELTAPWASTTTQTKAAALHGAEAERQWTPAFNDGAAAEKWFTETVLPAFERGVGATVGIGYDDGSHIVRLQWVEGEGLRIDDPYGALRRTSSGTYSYYRGGGDQRNATDETGGDGAQGEDNLWAWQWVADIVRYVQWHKPAGVANS
jgi:hypothetical protein